MVLRPLACSPCLWYGLHAFGIVCMRLAWSACLWHSLLAFCMVCMPSAWSACFWHGLHTLCVVCMPWSWSACLGHGLHALDMVSMPWTWSTCLGHGLYALAMVYMPAAQSLCPPHGLHACSMVFMTATWSSCLWHSLHAFVMLSLPFSWSPCLWPCWCLSIALRLFSLLDSLLQLIGGMKVSLLEVDLWPRWQYRLWPSSLPTSPLSLENRPFCWRPFSNPQHRRLRGDQTPQRHSGVSISLLCANVPLRNDGIHQLCHCHPRFLNCVSLETCKISSTMTGEHLILAHHKSKRSSLWASINWIYTRVEGRDKTEQQKWWETSNPGLKVTIHTLGSH